MIIAYQFLCILNATILAFIFYSFNPINSNIPGAIMTSILALFFGLGSLSLKEGILKKGGEISFAKKLIGLLIVLGIYVFSSKYFIAMWNGEKIESKSNNMVVMAVEPTSTETTSETTTEDSAMISESTTLKKMDDDEEKNIPDMKGKAVMIWVALVGLFPIWIILSGGGGTGNNDKNNLGKK